MKRLVAVLLASTLLTTPVCAEDLEARVEALEQRVAALEQLLSVQAPEEAEQTTLAVGTWIVGEDINAGKYNLTCDEGSTVCYVYKSLDDKLNDEVWDEIYSASSQAFIDAVAETMPELTEQLASMYSTEVFNIYLTDGQCIEVEGSAAVFTP